jgi:single-strand DNA-binding protein
MSAHKTGTHAGVPAAADQLGETVNEVRLVGRLAADPQLRELPSGDSVWNLRVVVERPPGKGRSRQRADSLECAVGSGRLKQQVKGWSGGDVVQVAGSLRHRFFRTGGATASRVEVELTQGKLIRRAGSG